MINLENSPTLIRFADGRHIPTNKHLNHTQATKEKMSASLKGRVKTEKQIEGQSIVWERIRFLVDRGLSVTEISNITEPQIEKIRVKRALYKNRKYHVVSEDYFSPEKRKERKQKSRRGQPKRIADRPSISEDERKNRMFAHELWLAGLFAEDISDWEQLHEMYSKHQGALPTIPAHKLRLEIFLRARKSFQRDKNTKLLDLYVALGKKIDKTWFDISLEKEEEFIIRAIEGTGSLVEDSKGLFVEDSEGYRWRHPLGTDGEGRIIYDSSQAAMRRRETREMVAARSNVKGYTQPIGSLKAPDLNQQSNSFSLSIPFSSLPENLRK